MPARKKQESNRERKWSGEVTQNSDAMDLEKDIFKSDDPTKIAQSLKRSAERSQRRKAAPFRSAMSMLTFYINRAGANLSVARKKKLQTAKTRLREIFGREPKGRA
ncbi:DUF3175 domain-containing protein [Rhodoblastus sp.]|uniref:DUF3175 domain-containing protein n=1 Tax=Rhodoblastus sp. TaxID=1962975 RepID=UPI003F9A31B8